MTEPLKYYAQLANDILRATPYQTDKNIISDLFGRAQEPDYKTMIRTRLTIIDTYYSTNMSKRYYGIDDIVDGMIKISRTDEEFVGKLISFLGKPVNTGEIFELFANKYGIRKKGTVAGVATSLISKYAYFLTKFRFPIYDSLVCDNYPILLKQLHKPIREKNIIDFFNNIKSLNETTEIQDYDILDNLLWLMGKINGGSFSLLLSKDEYIKLISQIPQINKRNDKGIREFLQGNIRNEILNEIFNDKQLEFIQFVFELPKK